VDYPLQSAGQLSAHLRSLRKARGISQLQLGALLGVGQTRIARIERDPGDVSVEQFLEVLSALGVQLVLRTAASRAPLEPPRSGSPTKTGAASAAPATDEPW
jgi:HTH-type transcriptional regulator/antitoxin HipB